MTPFGPLGNATTTGRKVFLIGEFPPKISTFVSRIFSCSRFPWLFYRIVWNWSFLIFLRVKIFTNSDRTHPYLDTIFQIFQTSEILGKKALLLQQNGPLGPLLSEIIFPQNWIKSNEGVLLCIVKFFRSKNIRKVKFRCSEKNEQTWKSGRRNNCAKKTLEEKISDTNGPYPWCCARVTQQIQTVELLQFYLGKLNELSTTPAITSCRRCCKL